MINHVVVGLETAAPGSLRISGIPIMAYTACADCFIEAEGRDMPHSAPAAPLDSSPAVKPV